MQVLTFAALVSQSVFESAFKIRKTFITHVVGFTYLRPLFLCHMILPSELLDRALSAPSFVEETNFLAHLYHIGTAGEFDRHEGDANTGSDNFRSCRAFDRGQQRELCA